jgi:Ca2+-binding EF-hand superfamily protein
VYLFSLIEKETDNSVTFLGWLPAISVYCLYSKEQLVAYVFQMLDQDHDHHISKKDIMKFLVSERFKQKTFPFSYVKAIELMEIERPDKITLDIFKKF